VSEDIYTSMNNLKKDTDKKVTDLNNKIDLLDDTINDISPNTVSEDIYTTINDLKKDTDNKITDLNNTVNSFDNTINDVSSNLNNKIKTISEDIYTAMDNLKKDTDSEVTNLNNEVTDLNNKVNSFSDTINDALSNLNNAQDGTETKIEENGYLKFPNGLIMQWMACKPDNWTAYFPIEFPNACLHVQVTYKNTHYGDDTTRQTIFNLNEVEKTCIRYNFYGDFYETLYIFAIGY